MTRAMLFLIDQSKKYNDEQAYQFRTIVFENRNRNRLRGFWARQIRFLGFVWK